MVNFDTKMLISYISLILLLITPKGESKYSCAVPYVCKSLQTCTQEQSTGKMKNQVLFPCATGKVCCPTQVKIIPTELKIESTTVKSTEDPGVWNEFSTVKTTVKVTPKPVVKTIYTNHKNYKLLPQYCGLALTNKVVDGDDTQIAEFPWMALIEFKAYNGKVNFVCGGTLITERYVLTAAHCVFRENAFLNQVRLGEWDLTKEEDCNGSECYKPAVDIKVEKVIPHENYNKTTFKNDIALLRLASNPLALGFASIGPICLPFDVSDLNIIDGYPFEASGWGLTGYREDSLSNILKKVILNKISRESCNSVVCPGTDSEFAYCPIKDTQICVQGQRKKDVCKGDSGGPLMSTNSRTTFQLGITSIKTTEVCGEEQVPSIFTRVESYLTWILDNMEP